MFRRWQPRLASFLSSSEIVRLSTSAAATGTLYGAQPFDIYTYKQAKLIDIDAEKDIDVGELARAYS